MSYLIITNTFKRDKALVQRSIDASLREISSDPRARGHLLLVDQNETPLSLDSKRTDLFTHLPFNTQSVSSARNKLFSLDWVKSYDWFIFCDDDGYMETGYIPKFLNSLKQNPNLEAIAGSILRDDNLDFYSPRHKIGGSLKKFRHTKLLMGSNFAVKREVFFKLDGFDERFGAGAFYGSGEETDFCWKCYFNKVDMEFLPDLKILHIKPYAGDLDHSVEKAYRYGYGKGALVGKWLILKGKPIVLYEAIEMIFIPLVRTVLGAIKFNKKEFKISAYTIKGRIMGFFSFLFQKSEENL